MHDKPVFYGCFTSLQPEVYDKPVFYDCITSQRTEVHDKPLCYMVALRH